MTLPHVSFSAAGADGSPTVRPAPSPLFIAALVCAQAGVSLAIFTPLTVSLSLRVSQIAPESATTTLSLVMSVGAVLALVSNPLFGALSDRTTSRFGRRRPWILGGMLVTTAGVAVAGLTSSVAGLTIGWSLSQLGSNAVGASLNAVVADRIPAAQRGRISGALGGMTSLAMVLGSLLATFLVHSVLLLFAVPALVGLTAVVFLCFAMRGEAQFPRTSVPGLRMGAFLKSFWVSPRRHPDFAWNFLGRFLIFCGLAATTGYQFFFIVNRLHQSPVEATHTIALSTTLSTAASLVGALAGGWLSDRTGRRKPFVFVSAFVVVAGLALNSVAHSTPVFLAAMTLFGLGLGSYGAVDTALAIAVLPDPETAAKDLGLLNVANTLPQSLIPVIAPLLLGIASPQGTNFLSLYLFGSVCAFVGAFAIRFVRSVV
ncbi:MFS transporter [Streptomyces zaehneri]|uniref:MFS transporter n=1 Tax=Streptomyces zaehneri TaxID=3051180 RepID=UPI0028D5AEFE|nr:MFS transporter [Streptomyces sp. DSM 40713]